MATATATALDPVATGQCSHQPRCPKAEDADHDAAVRIAGQPSQGWSVLCNGVVLFEDLGELLPDNTALPAQKAPALHVSH